MKSCILILCMAAIGLPCWSQSFMPAVIASAGTTLKTATAQIEFTLGEFMVQTLGSDPKFTQGFHQGDLKVTTATFDLSFSGNVEIYPNPTSDRVFIEIEPLDEAEVNVFSSSGILVLRRHLKNGFAEISTQTLAPGIYILHLQSQDRRLGTFLLSKSD